MNLVWKQLNKAKMTSYYSSDKELYRQ